MYAMIDCMWLEHYQPCHLGHVWPRNRHRLALGRTRLLSVDTTFTYPGHDSTRSDVFTLLQRVTVHVRTAALRLSICQQLSASDGCASDLSGQSKTRIETFIQLTRCHLVSLLNLQPNVQTVNAGLGITDWGVQTFWFRIDHLKRMLSQSIRYNRPTRRETVNVITLSALKFS